MRPVRNRPGKTPWLPPLPPEPAGTVLKRNVAVMNSATTIPAYWVHDIDPFVLRLGDDIGLRWYGLAYLLGFLIAGLLLYLYHKKGRSPFGFEVQTSAMTAIIIGIIVGGRVGYMLFYQFEEFARNPLSLFQIWQGGMSSHGGFIGCAFAVWWISRSTGTPYLCTADIIATLGPPGILLGRIANFINGELWGKVTEVPWAVIFPASAPPGTPLESITPRHPSQLYEAALEGLLLTVYMQMRFWFGRPSRPAGQLCGELLLMYALMRIGGEFFREPDASLILGLSRGVFLTLFLAGAGAGIIIYSRRKRENESPRP